MRTQFKVICNARTLFRNTPVKKKLTRVIKYSKSSQGLFWTRVKISGGILLQITTFQEVINKRSHLRTIRHNIQSIAPRKAQ